MIDKNQQELQTFDVGLEYHRIQKLSHQTIFKHVKNPANSLAEILPADWHSVQRVHGTVPKGSIPTGSIPTGTVPTSATPGHYTP